MTHHKKDKPTAALCIFTAGVATVAEKMHGIWACILPIKMSYTCMYEQVHIYAIKPPPKSYSDFLVSLMFTVQELLFEVGYSFL